VSLVSRAHTKRLALFALPLVLIVVSFLAGASHTRIVSAAPPSDALARFALGALEAHVRDEPLPRVIAEARAYGRAPTSSDASRGAARSSTCSAGLAARSAQTSVCVC
jgi:hypothetical protein